MIQDAASMGGVVVLLNSDVWLNRKKGKPFMDWNERAYILENIRGVKEVLSFNDDDETCCDGLRIVKEKYPNAAITFANGGDRTNDTTPEIEYCNVNGINLAFNVGGGKSQSSSILLDKWKKVVAERDWGNWSVLKEYDDTVKVKELVVTPNQKLSFQRHQKRNELWFVAKGKGQIRHGADEDNTIVDNIHKFDIINIEATDWHQLINNSDSDLHIVEIQWGLQCTESDIERKEI